MPRRARQTPPDCRPDNDGATEQEQPDSVSAECWIQVLNSRPYPSYSAAGRGGKSAQDRSYTKKELIKNRAALPTSP